MPHLLADFARSREDAAVIIADNAVAGGGLSPHHLSERVERISRRALKHLDMFPAPLRHDIALASQLALSVAADELLDPGTLYQPTATDYRDELRHAYRACRKKT